MHKFRNHYSSPGRDFIMDWYATYDRGTHDRPIEKPSPISEYVEPVQQNKFVCYLMIANPTTKQYEPFGDLLPSRIKSFKAETVQPRRKIEVMGASGGLGYPSQILVMENGLHHPTINLEIEENVDGLIYKSLMSLYNMQTAGGGTSMAVSRASTIHTDWHAPSSYNNIIMGFRIIIVQYKSFYSEQTSRSMMVPFRRTVYTSCVITNITNNSASFSQENQDIVKYSVTLSCLGVFQDKSELSVEAILEQMKKDDEQQVATQEQLKKIDELKRSLEDVKAQFSDVVEQDMANDQKRQELASLSGITDSSGIITNITKDEIAAFLAANPDMVDSEAYKNRYIAPLEREISEIEKVRANVSAGNLMSSDFLDALRIETEQTITSLAPQADVGINLSQDLLSGLQLATGTLINEENGRLVATKIVIPEPEPMTAETGQTNFIQLEFKGKQTEALRGMGGLKYNTVLSQEVFATFSDIVNANAERLGLSMKDINIGETFRTYDYQKKLYDNRKHGQVVAKPSESLHESGMAIDLAPHSKKKDISQEQYEQLHVLYEQAAKLHGATSYVNLKSGKSLTIPRDFGHFQLTKLKVKN